MQGEQLLAALSGQALSASEANQGPTVLQWLVASSTNNVVPSLVLSPLTASDLRATAAALHSLQRSLAKASEGHQTSCMLHVIASQRGFQRSLQKD